MRGLGAWVGVLGGVLGAQIYMKMSLSLCGWLLTRELCFIYCYWKITRYNF